MQKIKIRNKYQIWANSWGLGLLFLGILLFCLPTLCDIDGMDGGYALYCLGVFVITAGMVTFIILLRNAILFRKISKLNQVFCRWTIDPTTFSEFIDAESKGKIAGHKMMFWFIAVISVVVCLFLLLLGYEAEIMIPTFVCLIGFIWIVSRIAILSAKRKSKNIVGDIVIAREGGVINGTLHNWSQLGAQLNSIRIVKFSDNLKVLEANYTTIDRTGIVPHKALFPIPADRLGEAKNIVDYLNSL